MAIPRPPKKRGAPKGNRNGVGGKGGTGFGEKWPPKDFKPEFTEIAAKLRDAGCTNSEVAKVFGVDESTLYSWSARFPEFAQSLKIGGSQADDRVERSLFAAASGFFYEEEKVLVVQGRVHKVTVKKFHPPSDRAGQYWLNNRRRGTWKNTLPEDENGNQVLVVRGGLPPDHPLAQSVDEVRKPIDPAAVLKEPDESK